ncbi:type II toxin-antitoxin system PemK/MazF family toxin [Nocardia farcinica]|nr:type II toxin-antitoxin system PemK/MazF family toxin [Nocardia farcinica]MBF6421836.1 type II toxin-antitoxin system PemK/MazF family toxin [Nocardia farcinica]MBF6433493.1 type II toxin-antitoxin system PemK/MazF family toxin [Nocardia farcinica]MBF6504380.1 type II toxin-antitoxin system PemK/MazF family toxin [Nocardia farcinica]MBF6541236.1 type II toxin-antitoxin system PemK/MazF family toxin [Nocardia farcinica]
MTNEPPRRGEIFWADLNPARGSEQAGRRPVLIISPDTFNRAMRTVVTAALTTSVRDSTREGRSPVTVFLPAGKPLEKEGTVLGFQITTLAWERLEDYAGELTSEQMREVDRAIAASFGLANWVGRKI